MTRVKTPACRPSAHGSKLTLCGTEPLFLHARGQFWLVYAYCMRPRVRLMRCRAIALSMVLLLLIGGASSPALAAINPAVSPPLEQTSADTVFMEMLLAHNDDLNDENKKLLQADISGRLRYGA